ncbi:hypothetical protein Rsub_06690 [Raphidocelis subcapitata]|uniref:Uncharacterized protein n=1 Tax=Raphidocelis subcapitata TaxID=307507 RepID=A0A2V0PBV0_9CHLO|nr:hypothetical protein Rsub_06690 [Raphidocelis subcapitata]|eukprot:GBF94575.1 hypothetical protein Rsub_06690 [Raphidocelis subcapitata]
MTPRAAGSGGGGGARRTASPRAAATTAATAEAPALPAQSKLLVASTPPINPGTAVAPGSGGRQRSPLAASHFSAVPPAVAAPAAPAPPQPARRASSAAAAADGTAQQLRGSHEFVLSYALASRDEDLARRVKQAGLADESSAAAAAAQFSRRRTAPAALPRPLPRASAAGDGTAVVGLQPASAKGVSQEPAQQGKGIGGCEVVCSAAEDNSQQAAPPAGLETEPAPAAVAAASMERGPRAVSGAATYAARTPSSLAGSGTCASPPPYLPLTSVRGAHEAALSSPEDYSPLQAFTAAVDAALGAPLPRGAQLKIAAALVCQHGARARPHGGAVGRDVKAAAAAAADLLRHRVRGVSPDALVRTAAKMVLGGFPYGGGSLQEALTAGGGDGGGVPMPCGRGPAILSAAASAHLPLLSGGSGGELGGGTGGRHSIGDGTEVVVVRPNGGTTRQDAEAEGGFGAPQGTAGSGAGGGSPSGGSGKEAAAGLQQLVPEAAQSAPLAVAAELRAAPAAVQRSPTAAQSPAPLQQQGPGERAVAAAAGSPPPSRQNNLDRGASAAVDAAGAGLEVAGAAEGDAIAPLCAAPAATTLLVWASGGSSEGSNSGDADASRMPRVSSGSGGSADGSSADGGTAGRRGWLSRAVARVLAALRRVLGGCLAPTTGAAAHGAGMGCP